MLILHLNTLKKFKEYMSELHVGCTVQYGEDIYVIKEINDCSHRESMAVKSKTCINCIGSIDLSNSKREIKNGCFFGGFSSFIRIIEDFIKEGEFEI